MFTLLLLLVIVVVLAVSSRRQKEAYNKGLVEGYGLAKANQPLPPKLQDAYRDIPAMSSAEASRPDSQPVFGARPAQAVTNIATDPKTALALSQASRRQTINTTLYVASLLLVGGVVLFANTVIGSQALTVLLVWLIIGAYYVVGLWLYEASRQLKPVSLAFIGTALASMPFAGILFETLLGLGAQEAWLVTSAIALIAYCYAALRLRSQVLGYAMVAGTLSLVLAATSLIATGLVWFFVVTMLLSVCLALVAWSWGTNSKISYLLKPMTQVAWALPPITLLISLVLASSFAAADLAVIWLVAGIYYVIQAAMLLKSGRQRTLHWALARIVLSIALLFGVYAISSRIDLVVFLAAMVGVGQAIASSVVMPLRRAVQNQHETVLWFGLGLALFSPFIYELAPMAIGTGNKTLMTAITLALAVLASLFAAISLKRSHIGYVATAGLIALPWYVVNAIDPGLDAGYYALAYLVAAIGFVLGRMTLLYQAGPQAALYTAVTLSLITVWGGLNALMSDGGMQAAAVFGLLAVLLYSVAIVDRSRWLLALGNIAAVGLVWSVFDWIGLADAEIIGLTSAVATGLLVLDYIGLRYGVRRHDWMYGVQYGSVVAVGLLFGLISLAVDGVFGMIGMIGLLVAGSLIVVERQRLPAGVALLVGSVALTIGLQRLLSLVVQPDSIHALVYSHWWVAVFAALSYLEYRQSSQADSKSRSRAYGYVALSILTLFGLIYALGDNVMYRVLFLLEHAALVIVGLALSWRVPTWWGAAGIALAILYMFRGFTSLFLTLIGLIIIVAVIWVVRREAAKAEASSANSD